MLHACPALPRVTWPTTVSSSPTPVLSGTAPGYLADDCLLVADARVVRHCPRLPGRRLSPRRRCLCCPALPQVTWPTTVSSSPTPVSDTRAIVVSWTRNSFGDRTFAASGPQSGTVCRPISHSVGSHTASSGSYCRRFYSDSEATAQCELFFYCNK